MSTFQTIISVLLLVYVLSVIVQAIQEVLKALLGTKAEVMEGILEQFMGQHLTLDQVKTVLKDRGLKITDLENFNAQGFRHLLDGVSFQSAQFQGLLSQAQATAEQVKDHIAASYEAARAAFQTAYTRKNKLFVVAISFIVVLVLNANIISLYNQISVDSVAQQALASQAQKIELPPSQPGQGDVTAAYKQYQQQIGSALQQYPILMRTARYKDDFANPWTAVFGLLVMGALVSLGAPFWNDVVKSLAAFNKP